MISLFQLWSSIHSIRWTVCVCGVGHISSGRRPRVGVLFNYSTHFLETGSLTKPETQQFRKSGWPVSSGTTCLYSKFLCDAEDVNVCPHLMLALREHLPSPKPTILTISAYCSKALVFTKLCDCPQCPFPEFSHHPSDVFLGNLLL